MATTTTAKVAEAISLLSDVLSAEVAASQHFLDEDETEEETVAIEDHEELKNLANDYTCVRDVMFSCSSLLHFKICFVDATVALGEGVMKELYTQMFDDLGHQCETMAWVRPKHNDRIVCVPMGQARRRLIKG